MSFRWQNQPLLKEVPTLKEIVANVISKALLQMKYFSGIFDHIFISELTNQIDYWFTPQPLFATCSEDFSKARSKISSKELSKNQNFNLLLEKLLFDIDSDLCKFLEPVYFFTENDTTGYCKVSQKSGNIMLQLGEYTHSLMIHKFDYKDGPKITYKNLEEFFTPQNPLIQLLEYFFEPPDDGIETKNRVPVNA